MGAIIELWNFLLAKVGFCALFLNIKELKKSSQKLIETFFSKSEISAFQFSCKKWKNLLLRASSRKDFLDTFWLYPSDILLHLLIL